MNTTNPVPGRDVWDALFAPTTISAFNRELLISRYLKEFQFFYPMAFTGDEVPGLRGVVAVPSAKKNWGMEDWLILSVAHDGAMQMTTIGRHHDVLKAMMSPCRADAPLAVTWLAEITKFMEAADQIAEGRRGRIAQKISQVTAGIRLRRSETGATLRAPGMFQEFDRAYLENFQAKLATFMDPRLLRAVQSCNFDVRKVFDVYRRINHPDAVIAENRKNAFYDYPGLTILTLFPPVKPQISDILSAFSHEFKDADDIISRGMSEQFGFLAGGLKSMPRKSDENPMADFLWAADRGEDLKPAIHALFADECGELTPGMLARLGGQVLSGVSLATLKKCMPVLNEQNGKFMPLYGWQWTQLARDLDKIARAGQSDPSSPPQLK